MDKGDKAPILVYKLDGRLLVVWGDAYLHVFSSEDHYRNVELEPELIVAPEKWS
jgi:hypothetical protein